MTIKTHPVEYPRHREIRRETRGIKHFLARIGKGIANHVTFEEDAIFKDPDWPHLWDHKR